MITVDTIVAFAIRNRVVMDQLGAALRSDLCLANPFYRRIAEFADDFSLRAANLPGDGDWSVWLESLPEGLIRDGTREALGRLFAINLQSYDPAYFAEQALVHLQTTAASVARSRINEMGEIKPETFTLLAEQINAIQGSGLRGLARLSDIDTWAHQPREDALIPTGFPSLDRWIGGWGKELWIVFADSGVGKSMILQNWGTAAAVKGKRVLHITLELSLRPQILRYYRQLAQVAPAQFGADLTTVKTRLRHWFRFAQGEILLLEFPAYSISADDLKRTVERVERSLGAPDVVILDYLDLVGLPKRSQGRSDYADLGRITHEVRSLCPGFDLTVLTASQAVRRPERAGRLTVRDMGDSYQKVRGADGLLSLVQTDEEEEVHQGRLGILKVRDSGGRGQEVPLYINRELSFIQELLHPNTVELMTRLGHLPGQKGPLTLGVGTP